MIVSLVWLFLSADPTYYWYDGKEKRQLWLDPEAVVEFNPDAAGAQNVHRLHPEARDVSSNPRVRIWKLSSPDSTSRALQARSRGPKFSPMLADAPGSARARRALPGNIVVYLDPTWTKAATDAWIAKHHLKVVRKLGVAPNVFVFAAAAGLDALDTANRLYETGEVRASSPDWWQPMELK